jgi:hypothetical protein
MMKVSELTGEMLALWAARAAGYQAAIIDSIVGSHCFILPSNEYAHVTAPFEPHENWAQGGPIIEREGISLLQIGNGNSEAKWSANFETWHEERDDLWTGPSPLIAAMRSFVASKYGDEVPDE